MKEMVQKKLKTYLLYISMFCFFLLGLHLTYLYLYHDAEKSAIEGGAISEALIGDFPHFNPLIPSTDHNAYINKLLYRSILEFSPESNTLEPSIMSCDTSNILLIECFMESNILWSDGSEVSPYDIESTLSIIKQTKSNPIIASLLEDTSIEVSSESIVFRNTKKDINFLHVLLQPILSKPVIETLTTTNITGKFSEIGGVYSGRFTLINIHQDETIGVTKLTLGRNKNYSQNNMFIDFYILNLFKNKSHFSKHTSSFNVFNDKEKIVQNPIPRLRTFDYTLPQFTGVFFNNETLDKKTRQNLSPLINRDEIIQILGESSVAPAYNPFFTQISIDTDNTEFFENLKDTQKLYTKKELQSIALSLKQLEQQIVSDETEAEDIVLQENLEVIQNDDIQKYNFVTTDNILLKGAPDTDTQKIYVNDYELSGFSPGDDVFYYRLLESYDSIVQGENNYKIYFEGPNGKVFKEELYVYYDTDDEKLRSLEESFFSQVEEEPKETITQTNIEEIQESLLSVSQTELLSNDYLYYKDGSPFGYSLVYANSDPLIHNLAIYIQEKFTKRKIHLELTPLSLDKIASGIRNDSLKYDMLVLGIDTGYFASNIFPYFHSSQIENGYNLSNFKTLSLDILLEELKSHNISIIKRRELEDKMLDIFRQEQIIKVLYTPKYHLLVDQNIQNFDFPEVISDENLRYMFFLGTHLDEKRSIIWENKSLFGFIGYCFSELFH